MDVLSTMRICVNHPTLCNRRWCHDLCLLLSGGIFASAHGENLWKKRKDRHAFLYMDSKARAVGDLITVVISEDTDVDTREGRGAAKSSTANAGLTFVGGTGGGLGAQAADGSLDVDKSSSRSFDGESSFRSNAAITDRIRKSRRSRVVPALLPPTVHWCNQ